MRRPLAVVLCVLVAVVVAGCGTPPRYSLEKTRSCLQKAGLAVRKTPADDIVAQAAPAGSFHVRLTGVDPNGVTLSFGDSGKDAQNIADGYIRFHAKNVGVSDVLFVDKNVVTLWRRHPSDAEKGEITKCLK